MRSNPTVSAIVKDGASGQGEATLRLAKNGARAATFDANEGKGEALAREVGGLFRRIDITNKNHVDAALECARSAHGVERLLVNCAGIVCGGDSLTKTAGLTPFRRTTLPSHDCQVVRSPCGGGLTFSEEGEPGVIDLVSVLKLETRGGGAYGGKHL